jgi:glycerol-3-phosphate dehydrogenase
VLIDNFDRGLSLLRRLKALGVRIAMDDFGSGYSSLTYLQAFPFDKIKIDRAFVMNLGRNPQSAAIIRAMIGLGHGLNISIVAEGVETQEQLSFLADEACDHAGIPARQTRADRYLCRMDWPRQASIRQDCRRDPAQGRLIRAHYRSMVRLDSRWTSSEIMTAWLMSMSRLSEAVSTARVSRVTLPAAVCGLLCSNKVTLAAARHGGSTSDARRLHRSRARPRAAGASRLVGAGSLCAPRRIWYARCSLFCRSMPKSVHPRCSGRGFSFTIVLPESALPRPEILDLTVDQAGHPLKRSLGLALAWSDCVVDETRLVALNALDAAARGASILTGARCVWAERSEVWKLTILNRGRRETVTARTLVNASGAWTRQVTETVLHLPAVQASFAKISLIVVRRMFDHDNVYVLQNNDRRMIYAIPFHRDFTLIGLSERGFEGDPATAAPGADDLAYLCTAASRYFRERIAPADVVHAAAGCIAEDPHNGFIKMSRRRGEAPLLTVIGGATTGARRRGTRAGEAFTFFHRLTALDGRSIVARRRFSCDAFDDQVDHARRRWDFLGADHARRLVAAYGTRIGSILGAAKSMDDLGPRFGHDLTGAEVRYLMKEEFARFADDVLWRRSSSV